MLFHLLHRAAHDPRFRFIACGGFSAMSYALVQALMIELLDMPVLLAAGSAFVAGTLVSFLLNSRFTFRDAMTRRTLARFFAVTAAGMVFNLGIVHTAEAAGFHYAFGIAAALVLVPAFNYAGHRRFTYAMP